MKQFISIVIIATLLLSACTRKDINDAVDATTGLGAVEKKIQTDGELAKIQCLRFCRNELLQGTDLTQGPCLRDPISGLEDWVCDVAHNPRQAADNRPENQCGTFRNGTAKHFIEVDPNCVFIKSF